MNLIPENSPVMDWNCIQEGSYFIHAADIGDNSRP